MKRYTLLEMVQHCAVSINSDEVSSLNESIEVQDITTVVLEVLEDIANRREWSWRQNQLRTGTPAGNDDLTTLLLPTDCDSLEEMRYRVDIAGSNQAQFQTMSYLTPDEFLAHVGQRDLSDPNVTTITMQINSVPIYVYNNRAPRYYTSFEPGAIVLDAYDSAVDPTGLSASRSMLLVTISLDTSAAAGNPNWVAPIPTKFFSLWLPEAKAAVSAQLRKMDNTRAEREARRMYIRLLDLDNQVEAATNPREVNYGRQYRN